MANFPILIFFFLFFSNQALSHAQLTESTSDPDLKFDGFYIGANIGIQNVFGGSFVNEMDILAQEHRLVLELQTGYRKQFLSERFVLGLEFQLGFLNADLMHMEQDLKIFYDSNIQSGIGLTAGYAFGRKRSLLVFLYANETKRKFDVNIENQNFEFTQTDKQGMLKYGFGIEYSLGEKVNLRATAGKLNVDFGSLVTNIDVEDKMDFTLGAVFNF